MTNKIGNFAEVTNGPQISWGLDGKVAEFPEGAGGNIVSIDTAGRVVIQMSHFQGQFHPEVAKTGKFAFIPDSVLIHDLSETVPEGTVFPEDPDLGKMVAEATATDAGEAGSPADADPNLAPANPAPAAAKSAPASKSAPAKDAAKSPANTTGIPKNLEGKMLSVSFFKGMTVKATKGADKAILDHYSKSGYTIASTTAVSDTEVELVLTKPLG